MLVSYGAVQISEKTMHKHQTQGDTKGRVKTSGLVERRHYATAAVWTCALNSSRNKTTIFNKMTANFELTHTTGKKDMQT